MSKLDAPEYVVIIRDGNGVRQSPITATDRATAEHAAALHAKGCTDDTIVGVYQLVATALVDVRVTFKGMATSSDDYPRCNHSTMARTGSTEVVSCAYPAGHPDGAPKHKAVASDGTLIEWEAP